jgi:hypothetical protein
MTITAFRDAQASFSYDDNSNQLSLTDRVTRALSYTCLTINNMAII